MNDHHWDEVYTRKASHEVSWYRPHLEQSLKLIDEAGLTPEAAIIDVGAGAATLVDDLLDRGYRRLSMLDLSERGLDVSMERPGDRAASAMARRRCDDPGAARGAPCNEAATSTPFAPSSQEAASSSPPSVMKAPAPAAGSRSRVTKKASCTRCSVTTSSLRCLPELHQTPSGKQQAFLCCECRLRQ